jgi:hypothetical protein
MDVGAIIDRPKNVPLTNLGIIAQRSIENIPKYYPAISVDHYVIMPKIFVMTLVKEKRKSIRQ